MPSFERLSHECLFCDPARHNQAEQILLRSDNFYLFAGLGAIVDGYIIIAPYRCDGAETYARSVSELPPHSFDELMFLRWLVGDFYRDRFSTLGMSFEHGRAGACLATHRDTRHCYHGHLCCYPVTFPIWEDIKDYPSIEVGGPPDLPRIAHSLPYLYIETLKVDDELALDRLARVVLLPQENVLESQFLRKLLAKRVGKPQLWNWQDHPRIEAAQKLVPQFRDWLSSSPKYSITWNEGTPRIDFLRSVVSANEVGNDYAAEKYFEKYRERLIYGALGKFLSQLPDNVEPRPRLLDVACGPGTYAHIFQGLGLQVTAIDQSEEMLTLARKHAKKVKDILKMDALRLLEFDDKSFDGIWCSAFLVHVPRLQAPELLLSLRRVLKDDGVMYLSAQLGQGCRVQQEGRAFFYYAPEELQALFREAGFEVVDAWGGTSDINSLGSKRRKEWRHYLLKKSPPRVTVASKTRASAKTLLDLGERKLLERIRQFVPPAKDKEIVIGIGDDCAALRVPAEHLVVATTDPCPTPVISLLGDDDPWYRGWFSMIINLSDLGAMGAKPLGMLLSVEAPQNMPLKDFDRFYAGVLDAANAYDCPIIGGNLKDAPQFNCVGTALGTVKPERMLRRDTARPGERVVVLGSMGRFWAGLIHRLKRIHLPKAESELLMENLRKPKPRISEGRRLAELGFSRCAMDSSDGLTACFYELARCGSNIDIHLDLSDIQPDVAVLRVAKQFGVDVRKLLLAWGDWELVCTTEPINIPRLNNAMTRLGCPVNVVGWVGKGSGNVWLHESAGTRPLAYVASERFSIHSYFSHGLESYLRTMVNTPLSEDT